MKMNTCPICGRRYKMTKGKKDHNGNYRWWPTNQCGAHMGLKGGTSK